MPPSVSRYSARARLGAARVQACREAARFLIGRREQHDVSLERLAALRELDERQQVHDGHALRVDRAAPDHLSVALQPREGIVPPAVLGLRRHHVEVREQHDRRLHTAARHARPERRAAAPRVAARRSRRVSIPAARSRPGGSGERLSSPGGLTVQRIAWERICTTLLEKSSGACTGASAVSARAAHRTRKRRVKK
jgi:hypothetical protein